MSKKSRADARRIETEDDRRNLFILRHLRRSHGRIPDEVADFILRNPVHVPFRLKLWRHAERIVLLVVFSTLVAGTSVGLSMASNGIDGSPVAMLTGAVGDPGGAFSSLWQALHVSDVAGFLAAAFMLMTFSMTEQVPMRVCALATNVFFLIYAIENTLVPVILLHAILLPLNLRHLVRAMRISLAAAGGRIEPDM